MIQISINGTEYEATAGERLIDAINRARVPLSQVCYYPQLRPIQTCDTSWRLTANWSILVRR